VVTLSGATSPKRGPVQTRHVPSAWRTTSHSHSPRRTRCDAVKRDGSVRLRSCSATVTTRARTTVVSPRSTRPVTA
jgi:hypothetical protein